MENIDLIRMIIEALGIGVAGMIGWIFHEMKNSITDVKQSINVLNVKLAEILVHLQSHHERITRLEDRGGD